jgi:hypothetical protein
MILSDQACVVLGPGDEELGWFDPWSDEADDLARARRGYVVQANSEPAHLFADFRPIGLRTCLTPDDCPNGPAPHLYRPAELPGLPCCRQPWEWEDEAGGGRG